MNRIVKSFEKAFKTAKKKGWSRLYIAIDLHETAILPTWQKEISTEYYPFAKEVLLMLSERTDMCLILWSCSLPEINKEYFDFFKKDGINFDYINENPEVTSTDYADFETKLYFSVGLDDKFGFDPEEDWEELYNYLFLAHKENTIVEIDRLEFECCKTLTQEEEYQKLKEIVSNIEYTSVPSYGNSFYSKIDINTESIRILKSEEEEEGVVYLVGCLNWPEENKYYLCQTFEDILYLLKMKKIISI
jgi:hypothetical protein